MGQIVVQGQKVTVSDNFFKLPRDEQENTVDEIASRLNAHKGGGRRGAEARALVPGEAPFTWQGFGEQGAAGLGKGAIGAPGLVVDAIQGINNAGSRLVNLIDQAPEGEGVNFQVPPLPGFGNELPNSAYLIRKANEALRPAPTIAQTVTGEEPQSFLMRQPENTAEDYADTVGQFVGSSYLGPGSRSMKVASGVTGGLGSELGGQLAEGSDYENEARFAGGLVGVVSPHLAAGVRGSNVPRRMTTAAMGDVDEATLDQAFLLRQVAAGEGIDLSWPEAIEHVSNGATRLTDLQRVVENSTGGGPVMRRFYTERPEQIDAAAARQFDAIAPQPMIPERLGPRVQQAAEGDMEAVRRGINQQTRPLYQAAERQVLPPNHPALQDPAFLAAVQQVRNDPLIGPRLANLPDNSIGVIDEVQKILRDNRNNLRTKGRGYAASLTGQARRQAQGAARQASPEYDTAVTTQRQLRDQYLNPLEEGPTGKVAGTTDVGAQTRALLPDQPQAGSEAGVARAVRGIGRNDPQAAEGIIRQHLETRFAEATQRTQGGQNPYGGAKFSAIIAGNPQQRANLAAALRALPNGAAMWRGFSRFLDILEATGRRPQTNSATAFNQQLTKELEKGGATGEAAAIAASPQKAMSFIADKYKQFRLGRGTADLARLFTEGNVDDFRALLNQGPATPRTIAIIVRLLAQTTGGTQRTPASEPVQ